MKTGNRIKKIKSIVLLLCGFVMCIGATFGITMAFFGNQSTASLNNITLKTGIVINASIEEDATIENMLVVPTQPVGINATGTVQAYTSSGTAVDGLLRARLTIYAENMVGFIPTIKAEANTGTAGGYWVNGNDGFYYLVTSQGGTQLQIVSVGQTAILKGNAQLSHVLTNADSGKTVKAHVVFEVVQAELYADGAQITGVNLSYTNQTVKDVFAQISDSEDQTATLTYNYGSNTARNASDFEPLTAFKYTYIEEMDYPVVANKMFMGWYTDSEYQNKVEFPYLLTEDVTFYAKYLDGTLPAANYSYDSGTQTYQVIKNSQAALPAIVVIPDAYLNGTDIVDVASIAAAANPTYSVLGNNSTVQEVYMGNNITVASKAVLALANSLQKVYMPKVETLGVGAIYQTSVTEIYAPKVKTIDVSGCQKSTKLTTLDLPSIETIGNFAFSEATALQSVNMPNVKYIGKAAFQACKNLPINIPDSVIWIGDFAFNHCSTSTQSNIHIPASVVQIGGESYVGPNNINNIVGTHVFYDCATSNLTSFSVSSDNPYFVTHEGVLYTKDYKYLVAYPAAKSAVNYTMPEGCVDAFECSFSRAHNLKSLTLADSFTITKCSDNFLNSGYTNLNTALYVFNTVENFYVKATNTQYSSINGILYNKAGNTLVAVPTAKARDGVLEFADSITTINNNCGIPIFYTTTKTSINGVSVGGIPTEIKIGKNVTSISSEFIAEVNSSDYSWTITVDAENASYTTDASGNLVAK